MNDLSWFLYTADVLEGISILFEFFAVVLFCAGIAAFIIGFPVGEENERLGRNFRVGGGIVLFVAFAMAFVVAAIPSRQTMYMIAASEVGGVVASSPEAKEILSDLQALIRKQLKDALGTERRRVGDGI